MKVIVTNTTCDRCRAAGLDESIKLSIHGRSYELDLCERHLELLDKGLAPWLAVARAPRSDKLPAVAKRIVKPRRLAVVGSANGNGLAPVFDGGPVQSDVE